MNVQPHSYIRVDSQADMLFAIAFFVAAGYPFFRGMIGLGGDWDAAVLEHFPSGVLVYADRNGHTCSVEEWDFIKDREDQYPTEIYIPTMREFLYALE